MLTGMKGISLGVRFVEELTLTGSGSIVGFGNDLANRLVGNNGANELRGGKGTDTLIGNGGNDILYGGPGNDVLTGGAGSDTFVFHTGLGALNIDRITDYNVASDVIHLSAATFTALIPGALNGAAFTANAAGAAQDAQDRIIYETDTGHLYYDPDGTGSAARQHFATLSAGLAMTAGEFLVI